MQLEVLATGTKFPEETDFNPTLVQLEAGRGRARPGFVSFQSHIGAIRRNPSSSPNPSSSHFNPTLVQLEVGQRRIGEVHINYFNPTLVQLEAAKAAPQGRQ